MIVINKEQSLGRGFVILSVASITVKFMSLIFVPLMRSALGSEGYGVFSSSNAVFAFVYAITTTGMPVAISKAVTEMMAVKNPVQARQSFKLARTLMFVVGLLATAILMIFAKPIAGFMNNENSWMGIAVIAPNLLICAILSAYRGYFQGMKNMTPTGVSQVIEQIVHVIVAVVMVYILRDKGIVVAVAGASVGTVAGSFVALLVVLRYNKAATREYNAKVAENASNIPGKVYTVPELVKLLIHYSIPITINSAILYGSNMVDASILRGRLMDGGFGDSASNVLYGDLYAAQQLINVPASLVSALCISLLPVIAAHHKRMEKGATIEKANYCFKLCFMVTIPFAVAMAVFAEPIYILLNFGSNHRILTALAFSIIPMAVMHLESSIMQSVNRLYTATGFMAVGVIVKIILNYILVAIPQLNVYGAIISTYIAYTVPCILNFIVLYKMDSIRIKLWTNAMWPSICACLMVAVSLPLYLGLSLIGISNIYLNNIIAIAPSVVVAIAIYFLSIRKCKWLTNDDLLSISPKFKRFIK